MQRTVTVMGMNMLRHLGERGEDEDEEDEKHSDKGEAPLLQCGGHCRNCGSHINATAAANIFIGKVLCLEARILIPYCKPRCKSSVTKPWEESR